MKGRHISLFNQPSLEGLVQDEIEIKNKAKNYGLTQKLLKELLSPGRKRLRQRRDPEYDTCFYALKNIYHGLYNVDIPHEMYQLLNPLEIAALYYGVGRTKISDLPAFEFESLAETVSYLVGVAFDEQTQIFGTAKSKHSKPYTTNSGDMIRRMQYFQTKYPEKSKVFMESFYKRFNSTRNIDPNRDGYSIDLYVLDISRYIQKKYNRNKSL